MLLRKMIFVVLLSLGGVAQAVDYKAPEGYAEGQIEKLDLGRSEMVIQGLVYSVAPDVDVEIAGTFGAFTMLKAGMNVGFHFKRYADGRRVIIELNELNRDAEQH